MLPIFDRVSVRVRVRFNVQIKYSNSMFFLNWLSASCPVGCERLASLKGETNWLLATTTAHVTQINSAG